MFGILAADLDVLCMGCRYAGLLEAAMPRHMPKVGPIEPNELLDFCADSGYNCRLEPSGTLLMPPEYNVGMTDWERSLRLRYPHFNSSFFSGIAWTSSSSSVLSSGFPE